MNRHRHRPVSDIPLDATFCITCGQDIVRIAASPDRMAYWRAVRRVPTRSVRSVVPRPARLDEREAGWTEPELREAYGR